MSTPSISLRPLFTRFRQATDLDPNHPAIQAARPSRICPQLNRSDLQKIGQAWYALSSEAAAAYQQAAQEVFCRKYVIEAENQLQSIHRQAPPTLKLQRYKPVLEMIAEVLVEAQVDPGLIAQWKLSQYAQFEPEVRDSVKGAKSLIGEAHPVQNTLLRPTDIALELSQKVGFPIQAQTVNDLLVQLGLATRVGADKRIALTEKGKAIGGVATVATSLTNGWQGSWVKWPVEVLDLLLSALPSWAHPTRSL